MIGVENNWTFLPNTPSSLSLFSKNQLKLLTLIYFLTRACISFSDTGAKTWNESACSLLSDQRNVKEVSLFSIIASQSCTSEISCPSIKIFIINLAVLNHVLTGRKILNH